MWNCENPYVSNIGSEVWDDGGSEPLHILYLLNIHSKYTQYIINTLVEVISEAAVQY